MKYRPDINGLRSINVLSVIDYHYLPHVFTEEVIDVDIFSEVSGCLIQKIIFDELYKPMLSMLNLYQGYINCIFTTLSIVLVASLSFGWIALAPDEYALLDLSALVINTFIKI
jgi:peptidoglycan/LPS O-acetylase OafA/YrhL